MERDNWYILAHQIRVSDILYWDRKSYLAHVTCILHGLSREDIGCIGTHVHGRQVASLLC